MFRLHFREDVNSIGIVGSKPREGGDYSGRGTFTGGRGGQKETREEYAERRQRMAKEKLEKSRTYAERLGIDGASSMSADRLESEIQDKKAEKNVKTNLEKERKARQN
ncbi:MAG: hypothetical protein B7Y25_04180 [Alphaproteobacteria bacterium 16-39-46]|nr:MAG: hypothetical protein B7Y25_04180 [Alphaproteobacteria bacterium 16-39-46]